MRRPPTRGPQDPWTPRTVSLRGHLFTPYPRRPTVDGAPPLVHLHNLYAGGTSHTAGNPVLCPAAHAAKIGWRAFRDHLPRETPRTLPCQERCFSLYRLAGLPGAITLRETPRPATPRALLF